MRNRKSFCLLIVAAACGVFLGAQRREDAKPRLMGLLDTYTQADGRVVVPVVSAQGEEIREAALEIFFTPQKLALVGVRGRVGVEARVVEEGDRMVVEFRPQGADQFRSGPQVLGYLDLLNRRGREYAEVLMLKASLNGQASAPGAARIHPGPRTQFLFLPGGQVMIPVWGADVRVRFDESQLEYLDSYPQSLGPPFAPFGEEREGKRRADPRDRDLVVAGSEDELNLLLFQLRTKDPRLLNQPLRLSVWRR